MYDVNDSEHEPLRSQYMSLQSSSNNKYFSGRFMNHDMVKGYGSHRYSSCYDRNFLHPLANVLPVPYRHLYQALYLREPRN